MSAIPVVIEHKAQRHIDLLREHASALAHDYHVASLALFGSYARNTPRLDSDLDVLVTFSESPTLPRFIQLEDYLSQLLAIKVDLVPEHSLKPYIAENIQSDIIRI